MDLNKSRSMIDLGQKSSGFNQKMATVLGRSNSMAMHRLPKLFLHGTRNTEVTCRGCRGGKIQVIQHSDGIARIHHCTQCKGTGVTRN